MTKYFILISLLLCILFACDSGLPEDNHNSKLNPQDSIRLYTLLDSLNVNYIDDNDKLISSSDQIVSMFPNNASKVFIEIAHLHFYKDNYYLAEYYFVKAATEFHKQEMMVEYAEQLSNIGVVREVSGSYPEALEMYFEALKIFESLDMKIQIARISNNIGILYQQIGEGDKSLEYYRNSLQFYKDTDDDILKANVLNNIATHFEEFVHDYDSALFYYEKARIPYDNNNLLRQLLIVDNNIGNIYMLRNELDIADSIFNIVLEKSIEYNMEKTIAPILVFQAELYCKQSKFDEAVIKAEQASVLVKANSNKEEELESLTVLYKVYEKQGSFKEANEVIHEQYIIQERLSGIEQKKQINLLNVKYEVDKKENKIKILELDANLQKRKISQLYLIIAIVVLLLTGVFVTYVLHNKNNKLINRQMQNDILNYIDRIHQIEEDNKSEFQEKLKPREIQILEMVKSFNLTEREKDVLLLLSKGHNNFKIAEELFVSVNTVKFHTKNIFIKLDVKNRIEAVQKAQGL
jgi:DNA-binding NarL/FixJ family response regulator